ncbi:MAG: hypothetical protein ACYTBJ_05350 [Planctomycetota bacterium]
MKKEGMFFQNREQVEDGMFMKKAQVDPPKLDIPKLPTTPKKPVKGTTSSSEQTKDIKPPMQPPKPVKMGHGKYATVKLPGSPKPKPITPFPKIPSDGDGPHLPNPKPGKPKFGHGKCAMLGIPKSANVMMGYGAGSDTPAGGNMNVGAGSPMGHGKKLKKKGEIEKAAQEDLAEQAKRVGGGFLSASGRTVSKAPDLARGALAKAEALPDWAKAAITGAGGLYVYGKGKKGVKSLAARRAAAAAKAKPGAVAKALMALRRLRGK